MFLTSKQAKELTASLTIATTMMNAIKKYGYLGADGFVTFTITKDAEEYPIFEALFKGGKK